MVPAYASIDYNIDSCPYLCSILERLNDHNRVQLLISSHKKQVHRDPPDVIQRAELRISRLKWKRKT